MFGDKKKNICAFLRYATSSVALLALSSCAAVNAPQPRSVDIKPPARAGNRPDAINEGYEPVIYVPLGPDVLVPQSDIDLRLPEEYVGPYELRGETLAGALQLILADFDIPLAFETELGLTRRVTVANLKGSLNDVIGRVCGLADLYCAYEDGLLIVKETETFTVSLPPLGGGSGEVEQSDLFNNIAEGLEALTGSQVVVDEATRTIIYTSSHRNAKRAKKYFDRLRNNTALIIYETYIWEVELSGGNTTGIRWENIDSIGTYDIGLSSGNTANTEVGAPISIGLPTRGTVNFNTGDVIQFLSSQGTVKTISQPQVTVLSGSAATLRVAETINYIESLSRTTDEDGDETVSTTTATVDSGFELTIESSWDDATVYGNFDIELDDFQGFENFNAGDDEELRLPRVTERDLNTQVRVRPGDSILIAGLVTERDQFDTEGPGFEKPLFPTGRTALTQNSELVFLLRPRVVVYVSEEEQIKNPSLKMVGEKRKPAVSLSTLISPDIETESSGKKYSSKEDSQKSTRKVMKPILDEEQQKSVAPAPRQKPEERKVIRQTPSLAPTDAIDNPTIVPMQPGLQTQSPASEKETVGQTSQQTTPQNEAPSEMPQPSPVVTPSEDFSQVIRRAVPQVGASQKTINAVNSAAQTQSQKFENAEKERLELINELNQNSLAPATGQEQGSSSDPKNPVSSLTGDMLNPSGGSN